MLAHKHDLNIKAPPRQRPKMLDPKFESGAILKHKKHMKSQIRRHSQQSHQWTVLWLQSTTLRSLRNIHFSSNTKFVFTI